jgi:phosphoglycerate dehydrogenase-like enzyme
MPKVLITARYFAVDPEPLAVLRAHGCELVHSALDWTLGDGNVSEGRAIELLQDVDAAIISSLPVTARVLAYAETLRVIAMRGVGYDSVDIAAATARGIPVVIAPGFTESVADYTFALMLAVTRRVALADRIVRGGRWEVLVSTNICGKTLGIVGLGRIGKAVARRARGFDMQVLATDVVQDEAFARQYAVTYWPLPELLRRADIVSINAPLSGETRHLIDDQALRLEKATAFLINTARWSRR